MLLPEGYSLTAAADATLSAVNPSGDFLQLQVRPSNLPGPMLSLLRHNRAQFLQILGAQAPALLSQAVAAEAAKYSNAPLVPPVQLEPIDSQVVLLPAGSTLFLSTQFEIRGARRTLVLWLLAPDSLKSFYVLSLSALAPLAEVQSLMAPVLDSLRLQA
jgi:hypothetical protein